MEEHLIDEEAELISRDHIKNSSPAGVVVFSTLVAVCGSFSYGCASGYSSQAESGIREDLGLSVAAFSIFGSIMTIGGMMGAISSGKIADLLGRRTAMWFSDIFCTIGWLAIAFAQDALWLDLGRVCIGIGIGITSYVVPVYIAEIAPKDARGLFSYINQFMNSCGFSLFYLIGNVISWRILALLGVIPCLIQFVGLFFVPESPRWLIKIGRENEFENALQYLRGKNSDCSEEAADIREHFEKSQQHSETGVLELFQRKYANALIIGVGLMLLQQGGLTALAYYASSIFEKADFSATIGTSAAAIIQIPGVVLGVVLMDKAGRRPLLLISASGLCCTYLITGSAFCFQEAHLLKNVTPFLIFFSSMGSSIFNAVGMAGIPWVIMSEIFPLNVKASAESLVTLVNWSSSWIVTYTFNFMMEWSSTGTFFIFCGICAATVVFIAKMVPETKGRTLEEIQASVRSRLILQ